MITPAYAPTATERVLPKLALDFTTGVLDPRITFTRSLNTATRVNSSGFIETVNANLPRFDYDPVTLAAKGLLIEETRTNLLRYSAQFDDPNWTKDNASISANAVQSPDGLQTADKLVEDTATSSHRVWQGQTTTAAAHTFSVYLKAAERTFALLYTNNANAGVMVNLSTGATNTVAGINAPTTVVVTSAGNGWFRCSMTFTATAASNAVFVYAATDSSTYSYAGDGTSGIYLWGAQLELGAFATSYIPTTTTSATRNGDVAQMTGTNFSSWYNASQGSFVVKASTFSAVSTDKFIANANAGGFPNRFLCYFAATNNMAINVVTNSVGQQTMYSGAVVPLNTVSKATMAAKLNSFAISRDKLAPTTATSGTMPIGADRLWIGSATTTAFLNGHIQYIAYYLQRVLNAETQAFSG